MTANLNKPRRFYDANPNYAGVHLPSAVLEVAYRLEKRKVSLREALKQIRAVTNGEVSLGNGVICLYVGSGLYGCGWRIINFE